MQSFGKPDCQIFSKGFYGLLILFFVAALTVLWCFSGPTLADGDAVMREAAQKLSERVVSISGLHGPMRFAWHPDANWSEGEGNLWEEILKREFDRRALNVTEDTGAPALDVFATETPTQVVLTAKTRVLDREEEVRIVAVARALLPAGSLPKAPVRLERLLVYESPDRILDASSGGGSENGLVLLLYRNFEILALRIDSAGAVKQNVSLNSANLKPSRDPRAEIVTHGNGVSVLLLGKTCEFSWEVPEDVKCRGEKTSWRTDTWLTSPCDGSSWKVLRSGSEPNAREVLQVIPDGARRESSAAVLSEFPGPIVVINGEPDPNSAFVISQNLRTGNYEVYKITLACGN